MITTIAAAVIGAPLGFSTVLALAGWRRARRVRRAEVERQQIYADFDRTFPDEHDRDLTNWELEKIGQRYANTDRGADVNRELDMFAARVAMGMACAHHPSTVGKISNLCHEVATAACEQWGVLEETDQ